MHMLYKKYFFIQHTRYIENLSPHNTYKYTGFYTTLSTIFTQDLSSDAQEKILNETPRSTAFFHEFFGMHA